MTLATGDKIKHKLSGNEYVVISINPYNDIFVAKRDSDGQEIDFALDYFDRVFEVVVPKLPRGTGGMDEWLGSTSLNIFPVKCECGSDAIGAGRHSNYCPKWSAE